MCGKERPTCWRDVFRCSHAFDRDCNRDSAHLVNNQRDDKLDDADRQYYLKNQFEQHTDEKVSELQGVKELKCFSHQARMSHGLNLPLKREKSFNFDL